MRTRQTACRPAARIVWIGEHEVRLTGARLEERDANAKDAATCRALRVRLQAMCAFLLADDERGCTHTECGERSLDDKDPDVALIDISTLPTSGTPHRNDCRRGKMNWCMKAQTAGVKRLPDCLEVDFPRWGDSRGELKIAVDVTPVFLEEIAGVIREPEVCDQ